MRQIFVSLLFFVLFASFIPFVPTIFTYFCSVFFLLFLSWRLSKFIFDNFVHNAKVSSKGKAVLITGCDSGFGHRTALKLNQLGYQVFAGCLFPNGNGANELKESRENGLHVIQLDVTKDADVEQAVIYVEKNLKNNELWAVINNAGIVHYNMCEFGASGVKLYEDMIAINTIGSVRVTKAFLPILRSVKQSRVVCVSSLAGKMDIPYAPAYCMSKFAVRCFANALRRELSSFDMHVSIVAPAVYSTSMGDENIILDDFEKISEQTPESIKEDYGNERCRRAQNIVRWLVRTRISNADDVVNALVDAVCKQTPKLVYNVGSLITNTMAYLTILMPEEISDFLLSYYPALFFYKLIALYHRLFGI